MESEPLNELPVHRLSALIASGSVTSEAIVRACLDRIERREPIVRAWTWLDADMALESARERDGEVRRSPLHGIPVGVKDIIDTSDMPTGYGTPIHDGFRPNADAAVVALLRDAGAVVLGKTRTTELATFHPTVTTNPHDPTRTPGGSSSGSAAAVADRMVPAALGTQTYGSVIRPAAFCGVVGLKPDRGTVPRAGVKMQSDTLDTVGCFCRSALDLPILLAGMSGDPPGDYADAMSGAPRIAVCRGPGLDGTEAVALAALERAADRFRDGGAQVEELPTPAPFEEAWAAQTPIARFEMARSFAAEARTGRDRLSAALRDGIEEGWQVSRSRYRAALATAGLARARLRDLLQVFDALLTPAHPGEAPAGLDSTGDPRFNRFWTLAGSPCATLPCMRGPNRLPVGIQLVGPPENDRRLLQVAIWAESRLGGVD